MKQHYMVNRTDGIGLHASPARDARGAPTFVGAARGPGGRGVGGAGGWGKSFKKVFLLVGGGWV